MITTKDNKVIPEIQSVLDTIPAKFLRHAKPKTYAKGRLFNVTVTNRLGEILEEYEGISQQTAGRIRNENRRIGNRVSQIEISNLTGDVEPVEFVPPQTHPSSVIDKPTDNRRKISNLRTVREQAKYQQHFFGKANAELRRVNSRNNIHIYVYEKIGNKLRFSGTLGEAVSFIMDKMATGQWDETDWVIYLPPKIYEAVIANE